MRVNKWTWALAAAGLVSIPSAMQAEEKPSPLLTALSSTTISGYVDVSAHWNLGSDNTANPPPYIYNQGKSDGFNLNKVKLRIDRPLDEAQWSAGYRADLLFGPDANIFGSQTAGLATPGDLPSSKRMWPCALRLATAWTSRWACSIRSLATKAMIA